MINLLVNDPHQLLIRNSAAQLCGEETLSHPFFNGIRDFWDDIEDLRYPPCHHPPTLSFASHLHASPGDVYYTICSQDQTWDSSSDFDASPQTRHFNLSTVSIVPTHPHDHPEFLMGDRAVSPHSDTSTVHQGIISSPAHFASDPAMDVAASIREPCISTAHIVQFFKSDGSEIDRESSQDGLEDGEYGHCDIILDSTERSFNDSGLYFPGDELPGSWPPRKGDEKTKQTVDLVPVASCSSSLPLPAVQPHPQPIRLVLPRRSTKSFAEEVQESNEWPVAQEIAISLLCAGERKTDGERRMYQRSSGTFQLIARSSAKAFIAVKTRTTNLLRRRRLYV